jgi:hypothetical protein
MIACWRNCRHLDFSPSLPSSKVRNVPDQALDDYRGRIEASFPSVRRHSRNFSKLIGAYQAGAS